MKHSIAVAALVVTSFGLATASPVLAQDQAGPTPAKADRQIHRIVRDDGMGGRGFAPFALVCSDEGAEALEIAFVRLAHRLDLTDAQQPLFDALKAKALTTQTSFADECQAALPDRTADTKPDMLERLKAGLKVEEARLAAFNAVLPDFEAFYESLTPEQQADMLKGRMMRMNDRNGPDGDGPGRMLRGPAPGRG